MNTSPRSEIHKRNSRFIILELTQNTSSLFHTKFVGTTRLFCVVLFPSYSLPALRKTVKKFPTTTPTHKPHMFTRLVGVSRVRAYSTAQKNESALFLSDLMKRIDSINTRTKRISETQAAQKIEASEQKKPAPQRPNKSKKPQSAKNDSKPASPQTFAARTRGAKIAVKDHPLSRNSFKLLDESNFKKAERGPRRANPALRNSESRPKPKNNRPLRNSPVRDTKAERVVQRELVVENYKPAVGGDDFFYGKPASLAVSKSSRVAAVAKETLLESKYPYKLPKLIIDGLDTTFSGNKFILQNDYNLDVEPVVLGAKVNKIVKGQVDQIEMGAKPVATLVYTASQLSRNGDLSLVQKQTIYDVASGLKSAKLLVEGAVWNK